MASSRFSLSRLTPSRFLRKSPARVFLAGVSFGGAILVKQTAVFFLLPILVARFPRRLSARDSMSFVLGAALLFIPSVLALGVSDFLYWTWTYPRVVLIQVREQLSFSYVDLLSNLLIFLGATLPLLYGMRKLRLSILDYRVLWLIAGTWGILLGKGAFLHYFLLIMPPFALLAAEAIEELHIATVVWLALPYALGLLILPLSLTGIFWGTDLIYFEELNHLIDHVLKPAETMLVWGGSAIPLAATRTPYPGPFVLPRFAVPPYGTEENRLRFERSITADPPDLVLDLHERGDNRFGLPIDSEPALADLVKTYHLYVSPILPWAKFYFRTSRSPGPLIEQPDRKIAYTPFPSEKNAWLQLETPSALKDFFITDWKIRALEALELTAIQGRPVDRPQAMSLRARLQSGDPWDVRSDIVEFFDGMTDAPLPIRSPAWWPESALVELQPRS